MNLALFEAVRMFLQIRSVLIQFSEAKLRVYPNLNRPKESFDTNANTPNGVARNSDLIAVESAKDQHSAGRELFVPAVRHLHCGAEQSTTHGCA